MAIDSYDIPQIHVLKIAELLESIRKSIAEINEPFIEKGISSYADVLDETIGLFAEYANSKTSSIMEDYKTIFIIESKTKYTINETIAISVTLLKSFETEYVSDVKKIVMQMKDEQYKELLMELGTALIECYVETKNMLVIDFLKKELDFYKLETMYADIEKYLNDN